MCWIFHDWTKYDEPQSIPYTEGGGSVLVQSRYCIKCNIREFIRIAM